VATSQPKARIVTPTFALAAVASLAYFLAMGMVIPVLPLYVTHQLGGNNLTVGIVVGIFAVSAVVARPIAGRLGNRLGRRILVVVGALLVAGSVALYGLAAGLAALVALRLVTGLGEGAFFTGSSTLVADMAPPERRAQALSYFSVALFAGLGLGPFVGQAMYRSAGAAAAFAVAGASATAGAALATRLPDPRMADTGAPSRHLFHRKAVGPAAVLALGIIGLTGFQAYVPLYVEQLHMAGPQYVFLLYAGVVLVTRVAGASLADRYGVNRVASLATMSIVVGLGTMALWAAPIGLYVGAAFFGLGIALQYPALMALVVRRAAPHERSAMIGTFTTAFDVAQGVAGLLLGAVAAAAGYRASFGAAAGFAVVGLTLLLTRVGRAPADAQAEAEARRILDDPDAWIPPGVD